MRKRPEKAYRIYDSTVGAWCPRTDKSDEIIGGDWHTYRAVGRLLKREGFTFHVDPEIRRKYSGISKGYHVGRRGDVLFHAEIFPTGFRIEFHEDVVRDNSNGGRYTMHKMRSAPYLWRKRVELLHLKIAALLGRRGFVDESDREPVDALDKVRQRREEHMDFHGRDAYKSPLPEYNCTDGDHRRISDGERRWFYERNGRIMQGTAFHNINNMWWVVVDRYQVRNMAAYELFTYDPATHPRKWSPYPVQNLSRALERTVKARHYRKAAVMSDALARMVDSYDFKVGDQVVVENTRYHGPGVVDNINPPFRVGVKLPNGNVWSYEWATVRPAREAAPCS